DIIEAEEYWSDLPPEVIAAGWLGYPGATEEQIAAAEARLGTTLPPSYRDFLKVSNGWRMTTSFIERLRSTEEIEWYRREDPETVAIWSGFEDDPVSDEEYLVYGDGVDQPVRGSYFRTALAVSDYGDGIYLLNPRTVTAEGEWEAWFFAPWSLGATRYRSFWEMMQAEHASFLMLLKHSRGEPTPHADPSLGVHAEDVDGLIAALRRPDRQQRSAALQALGNLRDARAFDDVLAIFQDPDEDLFVRESAARTLGMLRDPRAVQPLIDAFRSPPSPTGATPLSALLGKLDSQVGAVLDRLSLDGLLQQMETMLGKTMGDHLRATLTPAAVGRGIAEHLHHAVRQGLLELGAIALPALFAALRDPDPAVRAEVVATLCYARGQPEVFEQVAPASADPDPNVRAAVAAHIEQLGDPRAMEPLLQAAEDPDARVRRNAAVSLGALYLYTPDERIPQTLTRIEHHDPDAEAREAARGTLRNIGR
ncbi:MAG TPA: HEAT repeat domain-containing protein, partial [Herpetosiphonaceae bacterium]|nr:HEAT repeat domain-containing protein [Herpetosiphonaceae bacterium]